MIEESKLQDQAASSELFSIDYDIPVLFIHQNSGKLASLPFSFQKTNEDKPLRISITDDTPGGSGNEIRDNLWLAAVTAAMLRNETMHGIKIAFEFKGLVDGPSAGAVCCIAILSALDGLQLPDDFAMTGAIFPDGTIGIVGGIVEKIKAAAEHGKTRIFIPGYHRMVKDANNELCDLVSLAEELHVTLCYVENIDEAFASIHGKPYYGNKHIDARKATAVPREIEKRLIEEFLNYDKIVQKKMESFSDDDIAYINYLYGSYFNYHGLFIEGKFSAAFYKIAEAYEMLCVVEKVLPKYKSWTIPFWGSLNKELTKIHKNNSNVIKKQADSAYDIFSREQQERGQNSSFIGIVPRKAGLSSITAQFENFEKIYDIGEIRTFDESFETSEDIKLTKAQFEEKKTQEFYFLLLGESVSFEDKRLKDIYTDISEMLPSMRPNDAAGKIENFFQIALIAAINAATAGCESLSLDWNTALFMDTAIEANNLALDWHNEICNASYPDYHVQVSLKLQIEAFVKYSVILALEYRNTSTDFEKYLIRNARQNALKNMQECADAGIPCIEPVRAFYVAESNAENDFISVLYDYWYAALYSKALLISFK